MQFFTVRQATAIDRIVWYFPTRLLSSLCTQAPQASRRLRVQLVVTLCVVGLSQAPLENAGEEKLLSHTVYILSLCLDGQQFHL